MLELRRRGMPREIEMLVIIKIEMLVQIKIRMLVLIEI